MKNKHQLYVIYAVSAVVICCVLGWNPLAWVGDLFQDVIKGLLPIAPLWCLVILLRIEKKLCPDED